MSGYEQTLLDETDRRKRIIQHGAILGGVVLLFFASGLVDVPERFMLGIIAIPCGFVLFVVAALVPQRWEVSYKRHSIRFENNPLRGEKLFIDGERVAKGQFGYRSALRATIKSGDGAGDRVVAHTEAGLLTFRCRIIADSAASAARTLDDAELLAETRRRGLDATESSR